MERGRKTKVITIIALVVAIVTMSLGFAVFSNVLTISSSATVKPNADDYVVNIYGTEYKPETLGDYYSDMSVFTSKSSSLPFCYGAEATPAIIDNKEFTISNLNVILFKKTQFAFYPFLIKNEGKNNIYLNIAPLMSTMINGVPKTCIASEGTNQNLVDEACKSVKIEGQILLSSGNDITVDDLVNGFYQLVPGDYVRVDLLIGYYNDDGVVADGEFTVNFDNIEVEFSSVDNS